jgi:hypothetical protein
MLLEDLEKERQKVMGDPKFQTWCKEFRVSIDTRIPDARYRAIEIMKQYESQDSFYSKIIKMVN